VAVESDVKGRRVSRASGGGDAWMNLLIEPYCEQVKVWPKGGRHILAQYDEETIIVYQAYRPSIGRFAAQHGVFGGDFSFSRMSG
jgi:hypothetical protein